MNWDAIGAVGDLLGAVAVVVTLIYLARQIGHSVSLARAEQNKGVNDLYAGWNDLIVSNPAVAEILGREGGSELSRSETIQIRHLAYRIIDVYNVAEFSHANGQISEDEFRAYKEDLKAITGFYPVLFSAMREIVTHYPTTLCNFEIYESLVSG